MSSTGPRLSIIIAAPPKQEVLQSVESLKQLSSQSGFVELIISRGKMPSIQRNVAVKQARGEWLYFLDDDSMVSESSWKRVVEWMNHKDAVVVGGPNLCPADSSFIQSLFALLMGSWLTFGPSRARYLGIGSVRRSTEKELILCNLMIRKRAFEEAGGFDEALYPNEENALMESIEKAGGAVYYDPDLQVERYPRDTLGRFLFMLYRYGCGRAQQLKRHPGFGSLLNLIPALFCFHIIVTLMLFGGGLVEPTSFSGKILLVPLLLYGLAIMFQTVWNFRLFGFLKSLLSAPMMFLCHLLYGAGIWSGLFHSTSAAASTFKASDVSLEHRDLSNLRQDS